LIIREYLADGLESFGRLRIINEDRIKAHNGFGFHSHQGLEIFTYVIKGELKQWVISSDVGQAWD